MTALTDYRAGDKPTPEQVRAARMSAGHTQAQATATVYRDRYQTWQEWEAGKFPMPPADFVLYLLLTGLMRVQTCGTESVPVWRNSAILENARNARHA